MRRIQPRFIDYSPNRRLPNYDILVRRNARFGGGTIRDFEFEKVIIDRYFGNVKGIARVKNEML